MRISLALAAMLATAVSTAAADVTLTVKDYVGAARKAEPVSTGVCFKPGEVRDCDKLALFDKAGQPVPAQFLPVVTLEDGSVQWALLDFQADCPANGSVEYVVKIGQPPAAPKQPVTVGEQASVYTLSSGPVQVVVDASTPQFSLIRGIRADGQPVMQGLAAGGGAMTCLDALDKDKAYHAGKPTKVEYDWRGPMRTTLMLEGPYVDDAGKEWLAYRVRVGVFAGSKLVRIEHELRNSCPTEVRTVKVKEAAISLGFVKDCPSAGGSDDSLLSGEVFAKHRLLSGYFSPALHAMSAANRTLTMAVVPRYEGGYEPKLHKGYNNQDKDPKTGKPADYNPGDTGSWWLVDCAYKVDEYWLGFGVAANTDEQLNLAKALDSRLYALAPAGYYSDCQSLGFGPFGTLEEEVATYAAWGWKNTDAKKQRLLGNEWMKARPGYHVASDLVHDETETDDAEGCLLMALRTGGRGYFDAGLAWARYYTNNFVQRTDFPEGTKRGPGGKATGSAAAVVGKDYDAIVRYGYGYGNGRTCGCHFYGGGAMDYYVLTGEKSLLLGCHDLVEYTHRWRALVPGKNPVGTYGSRGFGRQFLAVIRFYEITRDPEVKKLMDHMAQLAIREPNMVREDDWCFIDAPSSNAMHGKQQVTTALARLPRLQEHMKQKGLTWDEASCTVSDAAGSKWKVYDAAGSWEQTYVQQAMERYHRITGNKGAGDYVVRFANYFRKFAWNEHCQNVCYIVWGIHFPEKGMCLSEDGRWDPAHDTCPGPGAKHNGWYTSFGPDVAARAYVVSGDKKYLEQARSYWNRGSKLGYWTPKQSAADDEVGSFATHVPPKDDSILSTALMFHCVPRAK